ncbi:MAG: hypothetical protein ACXVP5_04470 [Tumebacillaceae bacterium]
MASRLIETFYLTGLNFYCRLVFSWLVGVGLLVFGWTLYEDSQDKFGAYLLLVGGVFFLVISVVVTWKNVTKRMWMEIYDDHFEVQYGFWGNKHTSWKWEEVRELFNQGKGVYILQKREPSEEQLRIESFYPKELWYEIVTRSTGIRIDENVYKKIRRLLEAHPLKRPPEQ